MEGREGFEKAIRENKEGLTLLMNWLKTHEKETTQDKKEIHDTLVLILTQEALQHPELLLVAGQLMSLVDSFYIYGYYRGRVYSEVPPCIEKAFKK